MDFTVMYLEALDNYCGFGESRTLSLPGAIILIKTLLVTNRNRKQLLLF